MAGVAVALVYFFALALWGLAEAIVAALALLLLPRAMFHAGLACFDAPAMTLWFATAYAYWRAVAERGEPIGGGDPAGAAGEAEDRVSRGVTRRRWPWQVGVVWGLALATKHTALLLPFALGVHYLVVGWRAQPRRLIRH